MGHAGLELNMTSLMGFESSPRLLIVPRSDDKIIESFIVKIFRGPVELARVVFRINYHADSGSVEYTGSDDRELDAIMIPITRRRWKWSALSRALIHELTMSTGGRYIPRFHRTPASDGRGMDQRLRRCFRERAIA